MKKKFNIIDLVIVLAIVAVIAAVVLFMGTKQDANSKKDDVKTQTVIVEVRQKAESFYNVPQEGDVIIDSATKKKIGTLVKKEVVPSKNIVTSLEEGKFVNSEIPGYCDLYLTLRLQTNENVSKIGKGMFVLSQNYACTGTVIDILEDEEEQK